MEEVDFASMLKGSTAGQSDIPDGLLNLPSDFSALGAGGLQERVVHLTLGQAQPVDGLQVPAQPQDGSKAEARNAVLQLEIGPRSN